MAQAIGAIGLGTSLAGGVMSAFGASEKGRASSEMYNYQAGMAEVNAKIAKQNADYARTVGEKQAVRYGMKAAENFGQIRTGQAASGLDVNSGSAKDVQDSQRKITGMDLATIREKAAKTAYDYEVQADSDLRQAGMYRAAGANARRAGTLDAIGSLISTASSVSGKWLQGRQMGLWGSSNDGGVTTYGPDMNITGYTA